MARIHERGRRGETLAARYLMKAGWEILDRNWRAGHAELDLVVRRGDVVAFVEVKARVDSGGADPLEGITRTKRGEVERAARRWILERGDAVGDAARESGVGELRYRFDAIAVTLSADGSGSVRHVEDAWWIGDA